MTQGAGDSMTNDQPQGAHVLFDYVNAFLKAKRTHQWLFDTMREAVAQSTATEVHAHLAPFDGSASPPGFAAVVLIDESHITAHSYADRGLLAVDCFTWATPTPRALLPTFMSD